MKLFKIEENDANQRLDKFLRKLFPNATRSLIYKINRKDKVKVRNVLPWIPLKLGDEEKQGNKFKKRDNEYKLKLWDEIRIFLSDEDFDLLSIDESNITKSKIKAKKFNKEDIVYEDPDLLVINKNPWINVHPGDFKTKEISLIEQLQDYLWNSLNSLTFKPSLVHRIDRDTSWILLVAKKKDILTKLVKDLKEHEKIKKTYYTIVLWKLDKKKWTIKKNLLRIEGAKNQNKVQISDEWQKAVTHYKLIKEHILKTKDEIQVLSEIEVQIETGRMHQIRVHMASIWNPIVWDKTYWNKRLNYFFEKNYWLKRHALHAWKIEFFHYPRNEKIKLKAKIKKDLKDFIDKIAE